MYDVRVLTCCIGTGVARGRLTAQGILPYVYEFLSLELVLNRDRSEGLGRGKCRRKCEIISKDT